MGFSIYRFSPFYGFEKEPGNVCLRPKIFEIQAGMGWTESNVVLAECYKVPSILPVVEPNAIVLADLVLGQYVGNAVWVEPHWFWV